MPQPNSGRIGRSPMAVPRISRMLSSISRSRETRAIRPVASVRRGNAQPEPMNSSLMVSSSHFFFQAEDGIRDDQRRGRGHAQRLTALHQERHAITRHSDRPRPGYPGRRHTRPELCGRRRVGTTGDRPGCRECDRRRSADLDLRVRHCRLGLAPVGTHHLGAGVDQVSWHHITFRAPLLISTPPLPVMATLVALTSALALPPSMVAPAPFSESACVASTLIAWSALSSSLPEAWMDMSPAASTVTFPGDPWEEILISPPCSSITIWVLPSLVTIEILASLSSS